jgi:Ca2+/Na+ antiporter
MFFLDMLVALLIALLLTGLFSVFHKQKAGAVLLLFFAVVFLATWAGGVWISPYELTLGGASWLSFLIVGLITAFLLAALIPPFHFWSSRARHKEEETQPLVLFNIFFWVLLLVLCIAIITRYLIPRQIFP